VTERATDVRLLYRPDGVARFRDWPLDLPDGQRIYLRVGLGPRTGEPLVAGADGAPLDGWRATRLGERRVAVAPAVEPADRRQLAWLVVDPETGRRAEDPGSHTRSGSLPMGFRRLDRRADAPG